MQQKQQQQKNLFLTLFFNNGLLKLVSNVKSKVKITCIIYKVVSETLKQVSIDTRKLHLFDEKYS